MPDRSDNRGNRNSRGNQQGFGQMSDRKRRDSASKSGKNSHGGDCGNNR
jgi:hypothetical protein